MAVSSNVDVGDEDTEVEWFNDVDQAVSWAADA